MKLNGRIGKLERDLGAVPDTCPKCHGTGHLTVHLLEPGQGPPKGGCPKCGKGWKLIIK